jgi:hypothetical protein
MQYVMYELCFHVVQKIILYFYVLSCERMVLCYVKFETMVLCYRFIIFTIFYMSCLSICLEIKKWFIFPLLDIAAKKRISC